MEKIQQKEIDAIILENIRRNREIFEGFNPVTGRGSPGPRIKVKIPDSPIKVQYMPERCVKHNKIIKDIIKCGSIRKYITDKLGWEYTDERYQDVVYAMFLARAEEDPAFYFAMIYKIVDKYEGTSVSFILNYGQRLLLAAQEKLRLERKPIRIVMPKARQFGGSTETQLYGKWMQDCRHRRWNMAIMAHQTAASIRIRAMYDLALENQPGWSVGHKGRRLKSAPFKGSTADFVVKTNTGDVVRESITTVASYENYDASRSANLKMAHLSEVAYWKETEQKTSGIDMSVLGEEAIKAMKDFRLPDYLAIPNVGLYLKQTSPAMISNYVREGLIDTPVNKKYYRDQLAYLLFISMIKGVASMKEICFLKELQEKTYSVEEGYRHFNEEMTNALHHIADPLHYPAFELTGKGTRTGLLHTVMAAAVYKIYMDKFLGFYGREKTADSDAPGMPQKRNDSLTAIIYSGNQSIFNKNSSAGSLVCDMQ